MIAQNQRKTNDASMNFERHVYSVQRYVQFTQAMYAQLFKPGVTMHPICCFGDPANARVITVGVNPSAREFEGHRWPAKAMTHTAVANRCKSYFTDQAPAPPHRFFSPWKAALASLGTSYESGGAVHVDLCPRATRYIRKLEPGFESELFLGMVQRDLWVFFATLALCRSAKLVLLAGTVTGRYYINEFLQRFAPEYGYALGGAFDRREHPGEGKTCCHELADSERKLPAFFCSCGPAADDATLLPARICQNAPMLIQRLEQ
jgi:hypothetical protein